MRDQSQRKNKIYKTSNVPSAKNPGAQVVDDCKEEMLQRLNTQQVSKS